MFPEDSLYPTHYKYKYPKAGEDNSVVDIYIYDLKDKTTKHVDMGFDHDIYLPRMQWAKGENQLLITKLNRHQNDYELFVVNADNLQMKKIHLPVILMFACILLNLLNLWFLYSRPQHL